MIAFIHHHWLLCAFGWYAIGVASTLIYYKYGGREEWARHVCRREFLIACTIGGAGGIASLVIMIRQLVLIYDWWDEKMF